MSVCTFLASNLPLPRVERVEAEDVGLFPLRLPPLPCELPYAAEVEAADHHRAAAQLLEQIRAALGRSETVELWRAWLMDYYEFEERPYLHTGVRRFCDLTEEEIIALDTAEVWNKPDKAYPNRPSFYRLIITR